MFGQIVFSLLIVAISSFLWRVRGGIDIWKGGNVPMNKIWYAVAFAIYAGFYFGFSTENLLIAFAACYISYQLYGWGKYIGALTSGNLDKQEKECELIDDLLDNCHVTFKGKVVYLWEYPKFYGFLGTCLTGFIITFLWGLFLANLTVIISGLGMGLCYWLGTLLCKLKDDGKCGWNWGEWIFGAYMGVIVAWRLLW